MVFEDLRDTHAGERRGKMAVRGSAWGRYLTWSMQRRPRRDRKRMNISSNTAETARAFTAGRLPDLFDRFP